MRQSPRFPVPLIFLAPVGFGSSASPSIARRTRSYSRRGKRLMDLRARRGKITSYKTRHLTPFRRAALPLPVACSAPLPSHGWLRREAEVLPHHALWLGDLHPQLAGRQGLPRPP